MPGPLTSPDGSCADRLRVPYVLEAGPMTEGIERLARAWAAYSATARRERESLGVLV